MAVFSPRGVGGARDARANPFGGGDGGGGGGLDTWFELRMSVDLINVNVGSLITFDTLGQNAGGGVAVSALPTAGIITLPEGLWFLQYHVRAVIASGIMGTHLWDRDANVVAVDQTGEDWPETLGTDEVNRSRSNINTSSGILNNTAETDYDVRVKYDTNAQQILAEWTSMKGFRIGDSV